MSGVLKNIAQCPECGDEILFKKPPQLSQSVICRACGTYLEVIQRAPIKLNWADDDAYYERMDKRTGGSTKQKTRRPKRIKSFDNFEF